MGKREGHYIPDKDEKKVSISIPQILSPFLLRWRIGFTSRSYEIAIPSQVLLHECWFC